MRARHAIAAIVVLLASLGGPVAGEPTVPNFWDPQRHIEKPDMSATKVLRFVTEDDYPPFNFAERDGTLSGFNVDLARALCGELAVPCTIQTRRWDTLFDALGNGTADAVVASIAITPQTRARVDFTTPYYRTPARFVARKPGSSDDLRPETLAGIRIGVESRTAHEAYLRTFFPRSPLQTYETGAALRSALRRGEIGLAFGDGVALASWLSSVEAGDCCVFRGGPYTESRFFGEGVGIAVRKGDDTMRRLLDYGLTRVAERGIYAELYLKYFPIGFY